MHRRGVLIECKGSALIFLRLSKIGREHQFLEFYKFYVAKRVWGLPMHPIGAA